MTGSELKRVRIRDITEADVPKILDYWYRSPREYVSGMGVDLTKLAPERDMQKSLLEKCQANANPVAPKSGPLIILYADEAIGMHTLYPLVENDHGVFHAHIWMPERRGKGIGLQSYPLACHTFVERHNLKRIVFKTPFQNKGAIRVKEKLGIPSIGEEIIDFTIMQVGTRAQVFEWSREDILTHIDKHLRY